MPSHRNPSLRLTWLGVAVARHKILLTTANKRQSPCVLRTPYKHGDLSLERKRGITLTALITKQGGVHAVSALQSQANEVSAGSNLFVHHVITCCLFLFGLGRYRDSRYVHTLHHAFTHADVICPWFHGSRSERPCQTKSGNGMSEKAEN